VIVNNVIDVVCSFARVRVFSFLNTFRLPIDFPDILYLSM